MEFSLTTFILEIVNFLVLIWLLKRFFYRPVINVIEQRQANIQTSLSEVEEARVQAEQLKQQYMNRLNDWEVERQQKFAQLEEELSLTRKARLASIESEMQQDKEKFSFRMKQQSEQIHQQANEQALQNAATFTRRLLKDLAGPDVGARLLARLLSDMKSMSQEETTQLQHTWQSNTDTIKVVSAFEIDAPQKKELEQIFYKILGERQVDWQYLTDVELIAGLRIQLGPWVLRASIQDEFEFFRDYAHEPE